MRTPAEDSDKYMSQVWKMYCFLDINSPLKLLKIDWNIENTLAFHEQFMYKCLL